MQVVLLSDDGDISDNEATATCCVPELLQAVDLGPLVFVLLGRAFSWIPCPDMRRSCAFPTRVTSPIVRPWVCCAEEPFGRMCACEGVLIDFSYDAVLRRMKFEAWRGSEGTKP